MSGSADVPLDAVVLAAGEGRRLRPLTERWPKPLLPIDGRPVLATLLRELGATGIPRVTVVVGHLGEQIESFLADGCGFGPELRIARQERPDGSADALRAALAAGADAPLLVVAADTVFSPGDIGQAAATFLGSSAAGALGVRSALQVEPGERATVHVEAGRVVRVVEGSPTRTAEGVSVGAPLWFMREPVLARLDGLPGPPFQLADALQGAIDSAEEVLALPLGPTRDLTRPADVVVHNFPYLWFQVTQRGPKGRSRDRRAAEGRG